MKKSFLLLLALPIFFGCSDSNEIQLERQTITTNAILNENSSASPNSNSTIYTTSANIDISQGSRIENVIIHSIKVKVLNYDCSPSEIFGTLHTEYNIPGGISIDAFPIMVKENYSGTISYENFLNGLESKLRREGISHIDFQAFIPSDDTNFEIQLGLYIDMTVVYAAQ